MNPLYPCAPGALGTAGAFWRDVWPTKTCELLWVVSENNIELKHTIHPTFALMKRGKRTYRQVCATSGASSISLGRSSSALPTQLRLHLRSASVSAVISAPTEASPHNRPSTLTLLLCRQRTRLRLLSPAHRLLARPIQTPPLPLKNANSVCAQDAWTDPERFILESDRGGDSVMVARDVRSGHIHEVFSVACGNTMTTVHLGRGSLVCGVHGSSVCQHKAAVARAPWFKERYKASRADDHYFRPKRRHMHSENEDDGRVPDVPPPVTIIVPF